MVARMIGERFGGLASRDRRAIREKIETEPKIRQWISVSQAKYLSQSLNLPTLNKDLKIRLQDQGRICRAEKHGSVTDPLVD